MIFTKIQIAKNGTLQATYKNGDGDIVDFKGANIVHKDLREAMQALVPHLALITEQREAYKTTLAKLREQRITDDGENIYKRMSVDGISLTCDERKVSVSGCRILTKAGVITVDTPTVDLDDGDYEYLNDLSLDIDAVKYEAQEYIEQRKWGVKEGSLEFKDIDPFTGIEAGDVPEAESSPKKGRKRKAA